MPYQVKKFLFLKLTFLLNSWSSAETSNFDLKYRSFQPSSYNLTSSSASNIASEFILTSFALAFLNTEFKNKNKEFKIFFMKLNFDSREGA